MVLLWDHHCHTLTNLFKGHHEKQWIEEFQGERPIFKKGKWTTFSQLLTTIEGTSSEVLRVYQPTTSQHQIYTFVTL